MAISSPLSLGKITQSIFSLRLLSKETTKKTSTVSKKLSKGIEKKKSLISSIKLFNKKRIDIQRRIALKDQIQSSVLVSRPRGPRTLALSDRSTSITNRLLGFIGYLSAGWLLSNIPTWIALGSQFSSRLVTAGSILSNYGDETIRVMTGIGNVFNSALENISRFDFSDNSFLVRTSLNDLKNEIDSLGKGFDEALSVLLQPFQNIPPLGSIQPDAPDGSTPPPTLPDGGKSGDYGSPGEGAVKRYASSKGYSPEFTAGLLATISQESGFNPYAIGDSGSSYGLFQFNNNSGRRQPFLNFLSANGIPNPASLFQNPNSPNAKKYRNRVFGLTLRYMMENEQGAQLVRDYRNSNDLPTIMGGFEDIERYAGSQPRLPRNKRTNAEYKERLSEARAYLKSGINPPVAKQIPSPTPQTPIPPIITGQRRLQSGDIFTKSLGRGVDYIQITDLVGAGRNHGGIDIAAPAGTYIALRVDCEVVAQGTYGNYGLLIDVWVPSLGIQLRMTHLSSVLIKSGKIPAGTSFARVGQSGRASGPHIHLEYDTKKGASRGGGSLNDDPKNYAAKLDQYVRLLLLTKTPNKSGFTPAPRPSATLVPTLPTMQTQQDAMVEMESNAYLSGVADGITQEREGRKIVVIDDRSPVMQQIISSGGGNSDIQIQISEFALLNNFMKNKLLLDLTYL